MTRVLIVDDEPQIRRALSVNLKARGYDVDLAPTGEDALRLAAEHAPDVVVLDLGLPGVDGVDVKLTPTEWHPRRGPRPQLPARLLRPNPTEARGRPLRSGALRHRARRRVPLRRRIARLLNPPTHSGLGTRRDEPPYDHPAPRPIGGIGTGEERAHG